jgi:tetratricopeptide (TPR) repeat protein
MDWWGILGELPSELGIELALVVRRLWLAAACPPQRRGALFRDRVPEFVRERQGEALALVAADVRPELQLLIGAPRGQAADEIAAAVEVLVTWAQSGGLVRTALNLAEAGAAVAPTNAHAAFVAARTNRHIGDGWRAEVFYRRAILFAHRAQQWKDYICAQLGLGTLFLDRGRLGAAEKRYRTAARVADDQGIEWLAAQTFHDLAALQFQHGLHSEAVQSLRTALTIYPRWNERVPVAVHDLAFLHVVNHHHAEALELLKLLLPLPMLPQDQVLIAGTVARAAGALGFKNLYAEGEGRVLQFAQLHGKHADAAMVNLAEGARALGMWALAAEHAGRAARLAAEADHAFVEQVAWELLAEISARKNAPSPEPLERRKATELRKLAGSLRETLGNWRWNPDQSGPGKLGPSHC